MARSRERLYSAIVPSVRLPGGIVGRYPFTMNIQAKLQTIFRAALADVAGDKVDAGQLNELVEMVRPSQDPKFGDYQANCAMPLGKRLGRPPREVAAAIAERLKISAELAPICGPPEIAGPGFINLRLKDDWLAGAASRKRRADVRLGVAPGSEAAQFCDRLFGPECRQADARRAYPLDRDR